MIFTNVRSIGAFVLALGLILCYPTWAGAQTRVLARIATGGDDLRGGNRAFISLVLIDGRVLPEQLLSNGLGGNKTSTRRVTFPETVAATQIRSIRIRHDGNPRSGHPFDTHDNWDLRTLRVNLADSSFRATSLLYDSALDSSVVAKVARFTGELRQIDLFIRAIGTEPDFIIDGITAVPRGITVRIRNVGLGRGTVTNPTWRIRVGVRGICWGFGVRRPEVFTTSTLPQRRRGGDFGRRLGG